MYLVPEGSNHKELHIAPTPNGNGLELQTQRTSPCGYGSRNGQRLLEHVHVSFGWSIRNQKSSRSLFRFWLRRLHHLEQKKVLILGGLNRLLQKMVHYMQTLMLTWWYLKSTFMMSLGPIINIFPLKNGKGWPGKRAKAINILPHSYMWLDARTKEKGYG